MELGLAVGGLVVGFVVGLTGMGGGALMTPMLVLGFGVPPFVAVGSDLVVSALIKPVGSGVHLKRGTVHRRLALWLVAGSVPCALLGVWLLHLMGGATGALDGVVSLALGVALVLVAVGLVLRSLVVVDRSVATAPHSSPRVRPLPTLLIGAVGGFIVGITSVGSGSLMMLALLLLYPALSFSRLVGTDLAQAVPLVVAAALAHVVVGDVSWPIVLSVSAGALPGVLLGARLSSRAPDHLLRPALIVILAASGLKFLGVPSVVIGGGSLVALVSLLWSAHARAQATARRLVS